MNLNFSVTPVSQNSTHAFCKRLFATTYTHNSAPHTSALASMIASENFTFTLDVSTKTRSASTGAPNPLPCLLTGRRRGGISISRQDSGSAGCVPDGCMVPGMPRQNRLLRWARRGSGILSDIRWRGKRLRGDGAWRSVVSKEQIHIFCWYVPAFHAFRFFHQ